MVEILNTIDLEGVEIPFQLMLFLNFHYNKPSIKKFLISGHILIYI